VSQCSVEELGDYSEMTVVEYAEQVVSSGKASTRIIKSASGNARQYLGSFGLGGTHAHRAIRSLSGGERMRLCFATVLAEEPHLLVLDEPTNHLDLETLDVLSIALDAYKGAVIVVSHNQRFLSGFCKELWVVEAGIIQVRQNGGDSFESPFSEYRSGALVGSKERIAKRQTKVTMARKAGHQRAGIKEGTGFIP
jgi:ATPase subunit of ABC transporter with duplicated ATPase domains